MVTFGNNNFSNILLFVNLTIIFFIFLMLKKRMPKK